MRKDGEPQSLQQPEGAGQEKSRSWFRSRVTAVTMGLGSIGLAIALFGGYDSASADREPIATLTPHIPTPVFATATREPIATKTPHPTDPTETPTATATPTATGTPRVETPTVTFTPTKTFTPTATVTGTPIIDYCTNVEGIQDLATVQRLIAQGVRIVNGQCVLPTPETTPTSTPIIKIVTRQLPVGFTMGENMRVLSVEAHPQLAKENDVAAIDILRKSVPLFGADVREAAPIIGNVEWNGEVIEAGIETYDIPEELNVVGQIDTGDPNKILIPGHSSLYRLRHVGTPIFSRLDEVRVGDTVTTFVNGESIPYNVIFAGKVTDLDAALNSYNGGRYVFLATCLEGSKPGAEKYLVVAVAPKQESIVNVPFIGEVPTEVAVAAGGVAVAGALALGASGALGIGLGRVRGRREELDTHEVPLSKIGL